MIATSPLTGTRRMILMLPLPVPRQQQQQQPQQQQQQQQQHIVDAAHLNPESHQLCQACNYATFCIACVR